MVAPATSLYEPAVQLVQALAPVEVLYFPAAHATHRADELLATAPLYVPTAQPVHTSDVHATATSLYVPLLHTTHTPPDW